MVDLATRLSRIGSGLSAMSSNSRIRERGLAEIDAREQADREARQSEEEESRKLSTQLRVNLLESSIKAMEDGTRSPEELEALRGNVLKLATSLSPEDGQQMAGVIGALGSRKRGMKLDDMTDKMFDRWTKPSIEKFIAAGGTDLGLLEEKPQTQEPIRLGPGEQLVSQSGEVLATNPNQRRSSTRSANIKNVYFPDTQEQRAMDVNDPAVQREIQARRGSIRGAVTGAEIEGARSEMDIADLDAKMADLEARIGTPEGQNDINAWTEMARLHTRKRKKSGDINATTANKWEQQIAQREGAINGFTEIARDMAERLRDDPDIRTMPGRAGAFFNEVATDFSVLAKTVAGQFNREIPEHLWNPDNVAGLRKLGTLSAEQKTAMLSLALSYAAASGMGEGRALSNADVERALRAVGANSGDPVVVMAAVESARDTLIANHKGFVRALTKKGIDQGPIRPPGGAPQDATPQGSVAVRRIR